MFLKSLTVQGFKSFPDKTRILFGDDITAIVGPNGSGKSNISDAIRWVMGEQSTKALRGARMEDVIFGGTQKRAQVGFAEATLTLDNTDSSLPVEATEVMITRRFYRSGESEFYVNKHSARLRDINELFMDTGLGREGYSNISQGRIDEILSLKSADRREIFEEAAGISKYRHRKEETENRLAHTDENLLRISDKISELEMQVEPLRRQAEKAKQYLTYQEELKGIQITLWLQQLEKLSQTAQKAAQDFTSANFVLQQQHDALDVLYQQSEHLQIQLQQQDLTLDSLRGQIHAQEVQAQHYESELSVLRNQKENNRNTISRIVEEMDAQMQRSNGIAQQVQQRQAQVTQIETQLQSQHLALDQAEQAYQATISSGDSLSQHYFELQNRQSALQAQQAGIQANLDASVLQQQQLQERASQQTEDQSMAAQRIQNLQAQYSTCAQALEKRRDQAERIRNAMEGYQLRLGSRQARCRQLQEKLDSQTVECNTLRAKIKMYQDMERAYKGFSEAVRMVMQQRDRGSLKNIYGTVTQLIRTQDDYTLAIETALGGGMQHILVETQQDAKAAMQLLKRCNAGRATFLPLETMHGNLLQEPSLQNLPGFVGIAASLISYDSKFEGVMRYLLGRIVVMQDLNSAIAAANRYRHRFKIVTLDGQVMNAGGSMTGGATVKSAGLLTRANELERLQNQLQVLNDAHNILTAQLQEANRIEKQAAYECETARGQLRQLEDEVLRLEGEQQQHQVLLDTISAALSATQRALHENEIQQNTCNAQIEQLQQQLKQLDHELQQAVQALSQAGAAQAAVSEESTKTADQVLTRKMEISALEAELSTQRDAIAQLVQLQGQMHGDQQEKKALLEACQREQLQFEESCQRLQQLQSGSATKLAETQQTLAQALECRKALDERKAKAERETQDKNKEILNMERECARLEQKKLSAELEEKQIVDKLWDTYQLTRSTAAACGAAIESTASAQRYIGELKRKIHQLGTPNLGAVEEFERVNERYQYLTEQRDDVLHAKQELLAVIQDITTQMTEIFTTEFSKINMYFGQTFTEMFGGGKASLSLDDPTAPLSCGIEINVQPPGKQLKTITLLSGGEKAFVAIALYFAILRVRPTPFCMLDEIDAALDDRNVERFANYLRTFCNRTQFIVVTHRRGTMEAADVLYGVTMQEQGVSKILHLDLNQMEQMLGIEKG